MKKDVLVKVRGTQTNELGEQESIELVTEGQFFVREKSFYILYNESRLTGLEGTTTSLRVEPSRVTLNRMGLAKQRLSFEKGILNAGFYVTPYGTMQLTVLPSRVEVDLTEAGGSINLEYELQSNRKKISDNLLEITVEHL
ncbi:MAG: hypothetical protein PWP65_562 [Clostridia bacterium]|nr:hypothetical protein [Clostridia bacterium]